MLFGLLVSLAIAAVAASIVILRRGAFYRKLDPKTRPRRWVLIEMLTLVTVFIFWFPIWIKWPHSLIARALTVLFGVTFFAVGMSIRWFPKLIDWLVVRKSWRLR